jgi:hypothetical protein
MMVVEVGLAHVIIRDRIQIGVRQEAENQFLI